MFLSSGITLRKWLTGSLLTLLIMACNQKPVSPEKAVTEEPYREQLINVNKKMVITEDELINDFTDRYQWKMNTTGTGLRYMIYSKGEGPAVMPGMEAHIAYSVVLLNGDTCYASLDKSFIIGKGKIEPGLDEGLRMMHEGDKAKFILPSHLAFGLLGDRRSIPQKATLVYDVHLLDLMDIKQ